MTDEICCDPIEGMCGGNHDSTTDFSPDKCYPWSKYRESPNRKYKSHPHCNLIDGTFLRACV